MKNIFLILLLFLSPILVFASEEIDKTTITEYKTKIDFLSNEKYLINNEYKFFTKFSSVPKEHYFYKLLRDNYTYSYKNNLIKYNLDYEYLNLESEKDSGTLNHEEGLMIHFGDEDKFLKEEEQVKVSYEVIYDKEQKNMYSYVISENQYDVDSTIFEILFPFELEKTNIYFSLNGKDYKNDLDGITYDIVEKTVIAGKYSKKISKDQILSFLVLEEQKSTLKLDFKSILIISIIILILVFLLMKKFYTKK